MDWEYSELISTAKWGVPDAQASIKSVVHAGWVEAVAAAGYKAQGQQSEVVASLWRDQTGSWTTIPQGATAPEAYRLTVTGTVVAK